MNNYVPNHKSELVLPEDLRSKVTVIDNSARPSFSSGHLARSWNECIIDAIVDINQPQCDAVILVQEDTVLVPGVMEKIIKILESYNYASFGKGDEIQILTPQSIKIIGLFDERFCNVGYQEADYFRRNRLYNSAGSSLNDHLHRRIFNPLPHLNLLIDVPSGHQRGDPHAVISVSHHPVSWAMYMHKWGDVQAESWSAEGPRFIEDPKQYMLYPFFERFLPDLEKKFICFNPQFYIKRP